MVKPFLEFAGEFVGLLFGQFQQIHIVLNLEMLRRATMWTSPLVPPDRIGLPLNPNTGMDA
jgi:hypothetical protein